MAKDDLRYVGHMVDSRRRIQLRAAAKDRDRFDSTLLHDLLDDLLNRRQR